jgi:hypothetical protein
MNELLILYLLICLLLSLFAGLVKRVQVNSSDYPSLGIGISIALWPLIFALGIILLISIVCSIPYYLSNND